MKKNKTKEIIMYYGKGCPYCKRLEPLIKKAERDLRIEIIRKEVWHNKDNEREFKELEEKILSQCNDGRLVVPTLYSTFTGKARCGKSGAPYEELVKWIKEEALK